MKIKTSELTGLPLRYAVAMAGDWNGSRTHTNPGVMVQVQGYRPDILWEHGGPIIDRAGINVMLRYGSLPPNHVRDTWDAIIKPEFYSSGRPESGVKKEVMSSGPTALIAAMRCFVASTLGDEVDVPGELT